MDERKKRRKRRVEMNGTSESIARSPKWIRPVSVVAAALIMALVAIPTASIAQHNPNRYNNGNDNRGLERALEVASATAVAGGLGYAYYQHQKKRERKKGQQPAGSSGQGR